MGDGIGKVIGDSIAWAIILVPLAMVALLYGLPHALDILGGVFDGMRWFAQAVRG